MSSQPPARMSQSLSEIKESLIEAENQDVPKTAPLKPVSKKKVDPNISDEVSNSSATDASVAAKSSVEKPKKPKNTKPKTEAVGTGSLGQLLIRISPKTKLYAYLEDYMASAPPMIAEQHGTFLIRQYLKNHEDEFIETLKRFANEKK